ncbi:MAG: metal ABC transporter substrate-binding protein [Acidimicrobiia bacterium]
MRRHQLIRTTAGLACCLGLLAACGDDGSSSAESTAGTALTVVTSTSQTADFVRVIGGTMVSATNVLAAGVDPHDFEPTAADLNALATAKVVVINGLGLESWFEDAYSQSGSKATIVTASDGIATMTGTDEHGEEEHAAEDEHAAEHDHAAEDEHDHGGLDPHVWHDPANAKIMVTNIAKAFMAADPANATTYQANLDAYLAELTTLDTDIAAQLSKLANRKLVTNHDAFGYFIGRYNLEFVGSVIPGFDTQAELSVAETNDLIDKIRAEGVKAIFAESSLPPKVAKAIADEAGVTVVEGDDALYGDSLGPAGSGADTYLTMMRHNANTIATHLS